MGIRYLESHSFIKQILQVDDTPENRIRHKWYFEKKYHHYRFDCQGVYGNSEAYMLTHTHCIGVMEGMEKSHYIETEMRRGDIRMNMPLTLMKLAYPENKMVKHVLTTFNMEEWHV